MPTRRTASLHSIMQPEQSRGAGHALAQVAPNALDTVEFGAVGPPATPSDGTSMRAIVTPPPTSSPIIAVPQMGRSGERQWAIDMRRYSRNAAYGTGAGRKKSMVIRVRIEPSDDRTACSVDQISHRLHARRARRTPLRQARRARHAPCDRPCAQSPPRAHRTRSDGEFRE